MEQLFVCKKPPLGQSHASVLVDDDGLAIVHRLLKGQLEIPKAQVTGVVLNPGRVDGQVALHREPRRLDLVTNQYAPINVLLLFDPPVAVPRFSYGANQLLSISRRERKHGVDVDAIGVAVDDPDGLVGAVARLGARTELTLTDAYVRLVGQAYGEEATAVRETAERRRRRARLLTPVFIALFAVLLAVRISLDRNSNAGDVGRVVLAALGWAVVIGLFTLANSNPPNGPLTPSGMTRGRSAGLLFGGGARTHDCAAGQRRMAPQRPRHTPSSYPRIRCRRTRRRPRRLGHGDTSPRLKQCRRPRRRYSACHRPADNSPPGTDSMTLVLHGP